MTHQYITEEDLFYELKNKIDSNSSFFEVTGLAIKYLTSALYEMGDKCLKQSNQGMSKLGCYTLAPPLMTFYIKSENILHGRPSYV